MIRKLVILTLFAVGPLGAVAQQHPYQNPNLTPLERARDLCSRLTLDEKTQLMMNSSPAIPRLGIPQFEWWSEALHGVARNGYATVFPQTTGMAASWDDQLLYRVFDAASDEARAKNNIARHTGQIKKYQGLSFWTPNINIFRDPRWGRGQETYGEDPYLTTRMGLAVVNGLQGQPYDYDGTPYLKTQNPKYLSSKYYKLLACAKHFAVHSGPEWNRHSFNIEDLPERDLWETYLPAFQSLVQQGNVREVMCAYQSIDGKPCCGNDRYLGQILRNEWHFNGLVVSDCGAISDFFRKGHHEVVATPSESTAMAIGAGTDVECGGTYKSLPEAIEKGQITMAKVDTSVVRLLKARFELGDFDSDELVPWKKIGPEVIALPAHRKLALDMARESMTLLQNRNALLPLDKGMNIVVMGPNAADSVSLWGNYNGFPLSTTTILEGIRQKAANVSYVEGCGYTRNEIAHSLFNKFATADGKPGMTASYWNNKTMTGEPVAQLVMREPINQSNGGNTVFAPGVNLEDFSATYEGVFTPDSTETLNVQVKADDMARVIINGDTLLNNWKSRSKINEDAKNYKFEKGKSYHVRVEFVQGKAMALCMFDIIRRGPATAESLAAQAQDADVVVFVGGLSPRLEGEEMKVSDPGFRGGDRTSIELPQAQRDVMAQLKRLGKRIVMVNLSGGAVGLAPETQNCDAILQAWYPGEAGGQAVADVLFGDFNPEGRLPVTFYRGDSDLPDFLDYRMANRTYRYFKGDALFPFGFGLSYTTFEFGKPKYKKGVVSVPVTNTGKREGKTVVEVYVKNTADTEGPLKSLRGFTKVSLKPGETQMVSIDLPRKAFEGWDASTNSTRVVPGTYQVYVGASSLDADLKTLQVKMK